MRYEKGLIEILRIRTTYAHPLEMLAITLRVIACATNGLKWTEGLIGVNLMAISHGQVTTSYILRKLRVIAVRFEHAQRAFIGHETGRVGFGFRHGRLYRC